MTDKHRVDSLVSTQVDTFQLALATGADSGVPVGATVYLYREVKVEHPETGELLGVARVPKLRLSVDSVHERFCLATVQDRHISANTHSTMLSNILSSPPRVRINMVKKSDASALPDASVSVAAGEYALITWAADETEED